MWCSTQVRWCPRRSTHAGRQSRRNLAAARLPRRSAHCLRSQSTRLAWFISGSVEPPNCCGAWQLPSPDRGSSPAIRVSCPLRSHRHRDRAPGPGPGGVILCPGEREVGGGGGCAQGCSHWCHVNYALPRLALGARDAVSDRAHPLRHLCVRPQPPVFRELQVQALPRRARRQRGSAQRLLPVGRRGAPGRQHARITRTRSPSNAGSSRRRVCPARCVTADLVPPRLPPSFNTDRMSSCEPKSLTKRCPPRAA